MPMIAKNQLYYYLDQIKINKIIILKYNIFKVVRKFKINNQKNNKMLNGKKVVNI